MDVTLFESLGAVSAGGDRYRVSAASASFGRVMEAASAVELRDMLRDIKRRNPGKDPRIVAADALTLLAERQKISREKTPES